MQTMRGSYCLVIGLSTKLMIRVGSLGVKEFPGGIYVYVGSAQSGIEGRVSRHKSSEKKRRWHIDYLLEKAEILSVVAISTERKSAECEIVRALRGCEGASEPVKGFGSSDCKCASHLVYLGDADPEWVAESITMRLAMLETVYPRSR